MPTNQLISELDYRYNKLQELLVAKKWKEADIETYNIILLLTYPEIENKQDVEHNARLAIKKDICINRVPCKDIYIIDRLWVIHSEERFSFST